MRRVALLALVVVMVVAMCVVLTGCGSSSGKQTVASAAEGAASSGEDDSQPEVASASASRTASRFNDPAGRISFDIPGDGWVNAKDVQGAASPLAEGTIAGYVDMNRQGGIFVGDMGKIPESIETMVRGGKVYLGVDTSKAAQEKLRVGGMPAILLTFAEFPGQPGFTGQLLVVKRADNYEYTLMLMVKAQGYSSVRPDFERLYRSIRF